MRANILNFLIGLLALTPMALISVPATAAPVRPQRPERVVSLNLCTDQLLVALADRSQIAGLTINARDPHMSAAAQAARGLPIVRASAEALLAIDPDLVLGMPARGSPLTALLPAGRFRAVDVASANRYADIVAAIRQVAGAVGHPARGEALVARMDRDLAALPKVPPGQVAAYYQRRGYLTGTGTLIDDLMRRVGLVNLAGKLGKPPLSQLSLEEMVAAAPDYLVVETATDRVTDQGTEMLHHPALAGIARISMPEAWTVCGGPAYVLAARALAQGAKARAAWRR